MKGYVTLEISYGEGTNGKEFEVNYLIVDAFSPYNIILVRLAINSFEDVISTKYLVLKFLLPGGQVRTILGD